MPAVHKSPVLGLQLLLQRLTARVNPEDGPSASSEFSVAIATPPASVPSAGHAEASPGDLRAVLPPWEAPALQRPDSPSTPARTARPFVDLLREPSFLTPRVSGFCMRKGSWVPTRSQWNRRPFLRSHGRARALTEQLGGAEVEGHRSPLQPESWLGRPRKNQGACREGVRIRLSQDHAHVHTAYTHMHTTCAHTYTAHNTYTCRPHTYLYIQRITHARHTHPVGVPNRRRGESSGQVVCRVPEAGSVGAWARGLDKAGAVIRLCPGGVSP